MKDTSAATPSRTRIVVHQSMLGLLYRFGAVAASFAMMPLMLQQLGAQALGVWLVLLSVFQWITFFDLGVASGARNEIARAVANGDTAHAKRAITTGWYYTGLISLGLACIIALALAFTPLADWLSTKAFSEIDASRVLWVVAMGSCVIFALNYIQNVFAAYQQPSALSIFSFLANLGFLLLLIVVEPGKDDGLMRMAVLYLLAMLCANGWLIVRFFTLHPESKPHVSAIDSRLRSKIMGFGIRLFVIQLAAMVIFTTDRIMVSAFIGPAEVVIYDAAFKVFAIITMVHTLVMSTMWSSFTHAYEQKDWVWIENSLKRLSQFMIPIVIASIIVALISPWIITLWLGHSQVGAPSMYTWFALVTILSCWSNIFAYFLNGIGDVKIQFYSAIFAAIINIPASYFFAVTMNLGITGVLMGTSCSIILFSLIGPWQAFKLLKAVR